MSSKKVILLVVKTLVTLGLLYWVSIKIDFRETMRIWQGASKLFLVAMIFPSFVQLWIFSIRWGVLLKEYGMHLSMRLRYLFYTIGFFFNLFFPGNLGGDVVRVGCAATVLKRNPLSLGVLAVIERFFGLWAMLILGVLGLLWGFDQFAELVPENVRLLLFGLPLAIVVAILLMRPVAAYVGRLEFRSQRLGSIANFCKRSSAIPLKKVFGLLALSILGQLGEVFASMLALEALHVSLPISVYMVVFAVTSIATVLPVSLGGIGIRESLAVVLLAHFGINAETAVAFALLAYVRQIIVGLAGGGAYMFMKNDVDISAARMETKA